MLGELITIICLGTIVAILNILHVIINLAKTLPGNVYLAIGHHYLDYLVYLQFIVQGIRGNWSVNNPFTTNDKSRTLLVYWPYLFLGKIASIFHISAILIYWIFIVTISIVIVVLTFKIITALLPGKPLFIRIITLLFSLFSTSFFIIGKSGNNIKIFPTTIWYSFNNFFERFRPIPHHLLSFALTLICLIIITQIFQSIKKLNYLQIAKHSLLLSLLFMLLLTFYPYYVITMMIMVYIMAGIIIIKHQFNWQLIKKILLLLAIVTLLVLPTAFLIKYLAEKNNSIEAARNFDLALAGHAAWNIIFLDTGPILFLIPLGIMSYFIGLSWLRLTILLFVSINYLLYCSSFYQYIGELNQRFFSPITAVLLAVIATLGIINVAGLFKRYKNIIIILLSTILLLTFVPVTLDNFSYRLNDPNLTLYSRLSNQQYASYLFLNSLKDDLNVLTPPYTPVGVILPVYADKKVYAARSIFTDDFANKESIANQFYSGQMADNISAKTFLRNNHLGYIYMLKNSGYQLKYPFLKPIFENTEVIIYQVV